jgi:hypothetical protein
MYVKGRAWRREAEGHRRSPGVSGNDDGREGKVEEKSQEPLRARVRARAAQVNSVTPRHAPSPVPHTMSTPQQQQQPAPTTAGAGPSTQASRAAAEEARKDRTLAEFLLLLDEHEPIVRPSALHLATCTHMYGCTIPDPDGGHGLLPPTRRLRLPGRAAVRAAYAPILSMLMDAWTQEAPALARRTEVCG